MPGLCEGDELHAARGGVAGELDERFVVGVIEDGKPASGELPFLGAGADGVEQGVDVGEGKAGFGGVSFEDFLVFVEEVIAEDRAPATLPQGHENIERRSQPGAKRRVAKGSVSTDATFPTLFSLKWFPSF